MAATPRHRVGVAQAIFERFPVEARLCINYTLRCNIECAHCNVSSSPHRRERLELDSVIRAIAQAVRHGKRHLTLSGGEVFLYRDDLAAIVAHAGRLGYEVDVETNAFFATSVAAADAHFRPLAGLGLAGVCLSCDAYHLKFYDVQRSIDAAIAADVLGLLVEVNFCPSDDRQADDYIRRRLDDSGVTYLENPLLNRGRARESAALRPAVTPDRLSPCDSLNTTIQATGDVFACCELEADPAEMKRALVYLGSVDSYAGDREAGHRESLLRAFYSPESPAYFKSLLASHESFDDIRRQRFLSICDFCTAALADVRRVNAIAETAGLAREGER